jgi:hypothetical protein
VKLKINKIKNKNLVIFNSVFKLTIVKIYKNVKNELNLKMLNNKKAFTNRQTLLKNI